MSLEGFHYPPQYYMMDYTEIFLHLSETTTAVRHRELSKHLISGLVLAADFFNVF